MITTSHDSRKLFGASDGKSGMTDMTTITEEDDKENSNGDINMSENDGTIISKQKRARTNLDRIKGLKWATIL